MRTFENFIESEAFFPVLILLLVLLVCVFMWIMMSNKKEIKKRRDKKKIKIDENAEIKIVSDGNEKVRVRKTQKNNIDDEPERTEIAIVEEVKGVSPAYNFKINEKKETIYDIDLPNFNEGRFNTNNDQEEIDHKNIDYGDLSVPPVPDIFKDDKYETAEVQVSIDNDNSKYKDMNLEIKDESEVEKAFNSQPSNDTNINEDIKYDMPNEYIGEKTEVFDFPDFDKEDIFSSGDIETEIINAAEDYIKNIMSK